MSSFCLQNMQYSLVAKLLCAFRITFGNAVGFVYSKSLKISKGIKIPSDCAGCDCEGDCANNKNCSCAQLNGSDLPYVSFKNVGR